MIDVNQNPEQKARDNIDVLLRQSGWHVQDKKTIDFNAGLGVAVKEYDTDVGPADYALFVDKKAVGVIEAKPESWGHKITTVEEQSGGYAGATLKWVSNSQPLPYIYESTGVITRFTNGRDPNRVPVRSLAFIVLKPFRNGLQNLSPYGQDYKIYLP